MIGRRWKWIAYAKSLDNRFSRYLLYSIVEKKSFPVTVDDPDSSPVFDKGGKYSLLFLRSKFHTAEHW